MAERVTHFDSSASLALARSASLAFRAAATSRVTRSDEVAREMEEDLAIHNWQHNTTQHHIPHKTHKTITGCTWKINRA